jgi:hypothetical protein
MPRNRRSRTGTRACWDCQRVFQHDAFSQSQVRKHSTRARCKTCVSTHVPAPSSSVPPNALPAGISVDLTPISGDDPEAHQFEHPDFGRAVRFSVGTQYKIEIKNDSTKKIAVKVQVDGQMVQRPPFQVRRSSNRTIHGFSEHRVVQGGQITTETSPFIAELPPAGTRDAGVDSSIGNITFEFFAVKWVRSDEGNVRREWLSPRQARVARAREGVLQTSRGQQHETHTGSHGLSNAKPLPDVTKQLGVYSITICNRDAAPASGGGAAGARVLLAAMTPAHVPPPPHPGFDLVWVRGLSLDGGIDWDHPDRCSTCGVMKDDDGEWACGCGNPGDY